MVKISRRDFINRTAVAGAILGFPSMARGAPSIVPSAVFGVRAPSNKIVMGCIGLGYMGSLTLNAFLNNDDVRMVAVCDVDKNRRDTAKNTVDEKYGNTDCMSYLDFRELIGRGDLDAVCISLPDHWHAIPAIAAVKAGLSVYGEKPLARSIREGRAMCDAVHRYGVVWQTGIQQRSDMNFRHACELVRNGCIGKVHKVDVRLPTGKVLAVPPATPVPDGLDWNLWLGPAPWRSYCDFGQGGPHGNWRCIRDYAAGQFTDWGAHHIDIALWGLGLDHTGPVEIEGKAEYPQEGLYNTPVQYKFTCKYADGREMVVADDKYDDMSMGLKWHGEDGWIFASRQKFDLGKLVAEPKSILKEVIGPTGIKLYESHNHGQNFLDCIRSRRETVAPIEVGHRSISVGLLGEIAMLTGRKIRWNPEKEEIIGDAGASELLGRSYREPWSL